MLLGLHITPGCEILGDVFGAICRNDEERLTALDEAFPGIGIDALPEREGLERGSEAGAVTRTLDPCSGGVIGFSEPKLARTRGCSVLGTFEAFTSSQLTSAGRLNVLPLVVGRSAIRSHEAG